MKNFLDEVRTGRVVLDNVNDWIDNWHNAADLAASVSLREWLGMSKTQYEEWLKDPESIRHFVNNPSLEVNPLADIHISTRNPAKWALVDTETSEVWNQVDGRLVLAKDEFIEKIRKVIS